MYSSQKEKPYGPIVREAAKELEKQEAMCSGGCNERITIYALHNQNLDDWSLATPHRI